MHSAQNQVYIKENCLINNIWPCKWETYPINRCQGKGPLCSKAEHMDTDLLTKIESGNHGAKPSLMWYSTIVREN